MTTILGGTTGRLATIHRSNGALGEALTSLTEWRDLREQYDSIDRMAPVARMGSADQRVSELLADQLASGKPDTPALVKAAAKVAAEQQAADTVTAAVNRARADLADSLDSVVSNSAASLFQHLDGQLQDLLTEACEVYGDLAHVRTADAAIDAGKTEQWKRLPDLESRYASIRAGQSRLFALVESHGRHLRSLDLAWMASPDAADPDYVPRRVGKRIDTGDGATRNPRPAPWPEPWSEDALRWFANNPGAGAWVPCPDALDAAEGRIAAACREFVNDQVARTVSA